MEINVYNSEKGTWNEMKVIGKYKYISDTENTDLLKGKIYYRVEPENEFRIVDDSDEAYLYLSDDFVRIED